MTRRPTTALELREIPLFEGLRDDELATLEALLHRVDVPAGASIITAQQPGEAVYIILRGTVKIHIDQLDGSDVVIALLGPGDTVGEMSLLDSASRSASVITQEPTALLWMDRHTFARCLESMPTITYNLVRLLSARLRLANEQIQSLAALDVHGRVARQILAFGARYGRKQPTGVLIPIRLTQSDIAGLVGASRERVNQAIVTFKRRKLISVDQRFYITLHDAAALARYCG